MTTHTVELDFQDIKAIEALALYFILNNKQVAKEFVTRRGTAKTEKEELSFSFIRAVGTVLAKIGGKAPTPYGKYKKTARAKAVAKNLVYAAPKYVEAANKLLRGKPKAKPKVKAKAAAAKKPRKK